MNTKHLMKKLPSCLLGAILAAGIASTTMVNAVDGDPPGLFELEGNIPDDGATAGDDWGGLFAGVEGANLITFTGITADPAPQTIYWKGGSKDINDVTEWWYKDGSVPDKDDITNAYAAAYTNPDDVCVDNSGEAVDCDDASAVGDPVHEAGDLMIYFGLDRYANAGDAFAGFWFFQDAVATNGNNQFTGQHVARRPDPANPGQTLPGDVLVLVEYPQASGAVPEIKVYEWDPDDLDNDNVADNLDLLITVVDAECDGLGGKLACAITNLQQEPSPPWDYTPKSGTGLPFESFFEGGINVTQLLGTTPCFASFLAETRASRSETATLKDFVIDQFPVCGIDVEKECRGELNLTGTGVDVDFFGTLENTGGSSYIAYLKDDQTDSTIDDVCIDTGDVGCADDGPVAGLVLQGDGSAYFPLPAKALVRFEGSYSVVGLPPEDPATGFSLTDEITAEAYAKVADIGTPELVIIDDADTAGCTYTVSPNLEVVKNCEVAFLNGDSVEVTISGTVENTGNVPLSNVTLTDSDFGTVTFPATLAVNSGPVDFTKTQTVSYASLSPLPSAPDLNGVVTVSLTHEDEVTASGQVLDSDGGLIIEKSASDTADCPGSFTTGIDVQKDCEVALDFDEVTGKIVVRVDVTATVTNLGSENLSGLVLTDDPLLDDGFELAGGAAVPTSLAAGGSFTATGSYFPSATDGGTNPNPGLASFSDTVDVTASGAFSALSATDENTAVCDLCPPVDAH